MKKFLWTLAFAVVAFCGITNVYAEDVDLNTIDTNTYIIGDRIYELNKYYISIYDVVSATHEYAKNHNGAIAPVYYLGETGAQEKYLIEILGVADSNGIIPSEFVEDVEVIYPGYIMDATAINNIPLYDYVKEDIEPDVIAAATELNKDAAANGFESITYDAETKTGTFTIAEPSRSLADYKDSGIVDMFLAIMQKADSVTYTIGGEEVTVESADLTQTNVIEIAYALLSDMAGDAEELNYASVANKSASATVKVMYDGFEYEETFTVAFVYDVEEAKDEELTELAAELNNDAANNGFESITYDAETKTGTFTISDGTKALADYKDSGIVDMFLEFIADSESVTYTIAGEEVTVETASLTQTNVIEIAYALLSDMAGDAEELNYASVANKTASAKVVYLIGGEEVTITYTLAFVYDVEEVKDEELTELAADLNTTAEANGFESITYDAETKTGTFTIADPSKALADYKDSGIVDMFLEFIADSESVTYTIAGEEVTVETASLTQTNVIEIAYALLSDMAGDAEELNYASVANKTASAKVVYLIGGEEVTITYTLAFVYDVEEAKDEELTELAADLNTTAAANGFESIAYDAETKTGTFTISDGTKALADYKDSGIVDMFLEFIADSESVTYTIAGEEVTVETASLTQTNVIEIAYALLSDLAGDAEELNYASVAGKSASAKVVYLIGGEEVTHTYTVAFVMGE